MNQNNQNNNPFSLPRLNETQEEPKVERLEELPKQAMPREQIPNPQMPMMNNQNQMNMPEQNKPIIEIPQEYYNKLEEEQRAKELQEIEEKKLQLQRKEISDESGKIFQQALLNAVIFFVSLYIMVKKIELAIFIIPIVIVVFTIMNAIKNGKESIYPVSVLIGGMIIAVITFVASMLIEKDTDFWFHLTVCAAVVGFLGFAVSSMITKVMTRKEEVPAITSLGYILFFVAIIGIPFFLYKKSPEEFHRIVFQNITEVKAETEEEFVVKTLKNRYNIDFTCSDEIKNLLDFGNQRKKSRICKDKNNKEVEVTSYDYNTVKNQYVVVDNYMNILFINDYSKKVTSGIKGLNSIITDASVYFMPEKGCAFVGHCVDSDEYRENLPEESTLENQYKISSTLDLSKYMNNYDATKFINDYKFKIVITVTGNYANSGSSEQYTEDVEKILQYLNSIGLENSYGFDIAFQRILDSDLVTEEFKVTGTTNSDKVFKDYKVTNDANS